jgi:Ca2+-transporting ATPase
MWAGILLVGVATAASTLLALDMALPGGLIEGAGTMRRAQTLAFTTLSLAQVFNAFNARSDHRSAFARLFVNWWLWAAVGLSIGLQVAVVYVPFLQRAFSTTALSGPDWLRCTALASLTLWVREANKLFKRVGRALRIRLRPLESVRVSA